ncbi:MAG: uroporphyrinogen-III synthase [Chloroflexi bacterium]|nr:uroporphyrinogen-III synthase [Chloroflexota bacterium]
MAALNGKRIALLEARMSNELANLVRRHGGEPYSVPAVREEPLDCAAEAAAFISRLTQGELSVVVFLTGVGADALFREAEQLGRLPELLNGLGGATTVCRGPKPSGALRRKGVPVTVNVSEPYTIPDLLVALARVDLAGQGVGLAHYGERNTVLAEALRSRGAEVDELCLYEWRLPDDLAPLRSLVSDLANGRADAVAFTSQIQVRHLFGVAAEMGQADMLTQALNTRLLTAAIGPTCAAALQSYGVTPQVMPEHPKMGHMVIALANALELQSAQGTQPAAGVLAADSGHEKTHLQ